MCELVLRTKADGTDIPVFSWKKSNGRGRELGSLQVHMIGKQRIQDAASLPYFTLYSGVGEAQSFCAGSNAEMQEVRFQLLESPLENHLPMLNGAAPIAKQNVCN